MEREAVFRGTWYPASAEECLMITGDQKGNGRLRNAVLPHAGLYYSGSMIREYFSSIDREIERIIILSPSHYFRLRPDTLYVSAFTLSETPFGSVRTIPLDTEGSIEDDRVIQAEHGLEMCLPFIGKRKLSVSYGVISRITSPSAASCIAERLIKVSDSRTAFIASSDFTHYGGNFHYTPFTEQIPEKLRELDLGAAKFAASRDLPGFANYLGRTGATICGALPIALFLAMLEATDPEGKIIGRIIDRSDSGEVTGDYSHVVDYVGILYESRS